MATLLLYLLKSGFCLIIFYLFFKWVMSRTTFFRLNRALILLGIVACIVLPFIQISIPSGSVIHAPLRTIEGFITAAPSALDMAHVDVNDTNSEVQAGKISQSAQAGKADVILPSVSIMLFIGYLIGALFVFVRTLLSFRRLITLIRSSEKEKRHGYTLVLTDEPVCSFNWGRYVVVSRHDYYLHPEILSHELKHLRAGHTWDLIFTQLIIVFQWFNPAAWLIERELKEVHEFQADSAVIDSGIDATKYQLLLVKKAVGTRLYSMASGFNHSKLKNRISMMLKEKTKSNARLRILWLAPLLCGLVLLFAQEKQVAEVVTRQLAQQEDPLTGCALEMKMHEDFRNFEIEKYGRQLTDDERSYLDILLLVNSKAALMMNGELYKLEDLPAEIVKLVSQRREESFKKSGVREPQVITMVWDRATDAIAFNKILNAVSDASHTLSLQEKAANPENTKPDAYTSLPFVVYLAGDKPYGYNKSMTTPDTPIEHIEVTLITSPEQKTTLRDFSLKQLDEKLKELAANHDPALTAVSLKFDPKARRGDVTDVREVITRNYKQ